jgi:hypothetical protein
MDEALNLIRRLVQDRFYGALTLKFEAGRLTTIKKEETFKPPYLPGQPRTRNDEQQ